LSYACYLVLVRPLMRRYPPLVVIAWVFCLSVPWVPLLVTWAAHDPSGARSGVASVLLPEHVSPRAWASIVFILVFPTALAYALNSWALSRVRASTTAVYVYVQPVITGLAGWIVLGEEITPTMLVSGACVFAGIWLVAREGSASRGPEVDGS